MCYILAMRTILPVCLLIFTAGCSPDFETVDEACHDKVPGSKKIENDVAIVVMNRINCYRRLAKVGRGSMDRVLQQATEDHMAYMVTHPPSVNSGWLVGVEEPGTEGFTGKDLQERLENLQHPMAAASIGFYQAEWMNDQLPGPDRVDLWFPDMSSRETYLAPSWLGGGYAETVLEDGRTMASLAIMYEDPAPQFASSPIIFPKKGQLEVPTTWTAIEVSDPFLGMGPMGYPISFTVGGKSPNGATLREMQISGPDGNLEYTPMHPGDHGMRATAGIIPLVPLEPNTEYFWRIDEITAAAWGDIDYKIDTYFTTRDNTDDQRGMLRESPNLDGHTLTPQGQVSITHALLQQP